MGRQARKTAQASFNSKFVVEKVAFHQHVPHGAALIWSHADHRAFLQPFVSLLVQSPQEATRLLTSNAAGKKFNPFLRSKHLFASYRA